MFKSSMKITIFVLLGTLLFTGVSLAASRTFRIMVFTKEKTVFVDDQEIKGLIDFSYEVKKDATIVSNEEPYVSYKGNLITGNIKIKSSNDILDESFKSGDSLNIQYFLSKDDKVTKYEFIGCKITAIDVMKEKDEEAEATYSFRASALAEKEG